jgi:hypothetical protein
MANTFIYNMSDTWSNASLQYIGIGMDVTDTASNANSALLKLSVGSANQFIVYKSGDTFASGGIGANTVFTNIVPDGIIMDYTTKQGRILLGQNAAFRVYSGNATATTNTVLYYEISNSGNMGLGTLANASAKFYITSTDSSMGIGNTTSYGVFNSVTLANVSLTAATSKVGIQNQIITTSQQKNADGITTYNSQVYGMQNALYNGSTSTGGDAQILGNAYGIYSSIQNWANGATANNIAAGYAILGVVQPIKGPITTGIGVYGQVSQANSTYLGVTTAYGVRSNITGNTGGITTGYLFNGSYTGTLPTNSYGVYVSGEARNYFSGNVGIANTTPDATLKVTGTANVTANTFIGGKLQVGAPTAFDFAASALIEIDANQNTYTQVVITNGNTGTSASGDFVITADTGNDSVNFVDLGINNSLYSNTLFSIGGALDAYLYSSNSNLTIGTASAKEIIFHANGTTSADRRLTINSAGVTVANAGVLYLGGNGLAVGLTATTNAVINASGMFAYGNSINYIAETSANATVLAGNSTVYSAINATSIVTSGNTLIFAGGTAAAQAANGWSILPNGMKANWGWIAANTSVANATFTSPFVTACLHVFLTPVSATATGPYLIQPANTTVAPIRTTSATAANVAYYAIGY